MDAIVKIKKLLFIFIILSITLSQVFAYSLEIPMDVPVRSEKINLRINEEQQLGDIALKYTEVSGGLIKFFVKKEDSEWIQFSYAGGVAMQSWPEWASEVVIHIEKIGAEGTEDLNYVTDDSEMVVWVEYNDALIKSCGLYIPEPKDLGLNGGNFYSSYEKSVRHWMLKSYETNERDFSYSFNINPHQDVYQVEIYDEDFFEPVEIINFAQCGDTEFTFKDKKYIIRPFFYMENGNWYVSLNEVSLYCGSSGSMGPQTYNIRIGLYGGLREPIPDLFIDFPQRVGDSAIKMDIQIGSPSRMPTYLFDDCSWKTLSDNVAIRASGFYGRDAEFEVVIDNGELLPPIRKYNPFWDKILEILGRY